MAGDRRDGRRGRVAQEARRGPATVALVALLAGAAWAAGCGEPVQREAAWTVLGAPAEARVRTVTESGAEDLLAELQQATEEAAALAGPDAGTDLARLQREASQGFHRVERRELWRTLLLALEYARASGGLYDPTLGAVATAWREAGGEAPPPERIERALEHVGWQRVVVADEARSVRFNDPELVLDLSGLDRGLALDMAARRFARPGTRGGLLRVGDQRYAWGRPPEGERWAVEVEDPRRPGTMLVELHVPTRAVAACAGGSAVEPGGWRDAVLDPRTGRPAAGDVTVAVAVAHSGVDAAALCRALLVGGLARGVGFLERTRKAEAVLFKRGEPAEVLASATLRGRLRLAGTPEAAVRYLLPPLAGANRPGSGASAPLVN